MTFPSEVRYPGVGTVESGDGWKMTGTVVVVPEPLLTWTYCPKWDPGGPLGLLTLEPLPFRSETFKTVVQFPLVIFC